MISPAAVMSNEVLDSIAPDAAKVKAMYSTFPPDVLAAYAVITNFVKE